MNSGGGSGGRDDDGYANPHALGAMTAAALVLTAYGAVLVLAAALLFLRRDVA